MITALITSKKSPRVIIVTGIVKKTRIGFKKVFNKAKTTATISAVVKLSTEIPGRKCAKTKTTTVEIKSLKIKFIIIFLYFKDKKKTSKLMSFLNIIFNNY